MTMASQPIVARLCRGGGNGTWSRCYRNQSQCFRYLTDRNSILSPAGLFAAPVASLQKRGFITTSQDSDKHPKPKDFDVRRLELIQEANLMTKSLYRCCLRCIRVLRRGTERDEADFRERLEARLSNPTGFAPPLDRQNELDSRANYYLDWSKENFHQESDIFSEPDYWREEDVERYVYFLQQGEVQRKWLLQDYGIEDPYPHFSNQERLQEWQDKATALANEWTALKYPGWKPSSSLTDVDDRMQNSFDEDDDFFDNDDFSKRRPGRKGES